MRTSQRAYLQKVSRDERLIILHLLRRPGCPVCVAEAEDLERFFGWFAIEHYYSPPLVPRLMSAYGLCPEHGWHLPHVCSRYALTAMYHYITRDALRRLERLRQVLEDVRRQGHGRRTARALAEARTGVQPGDRCLACEEQEFSNERVVGLLLRALDDPQVREAYRASDGFCVRHLARAAEKASVETLTFLCEVAREQLAGLAGEIQEFFRKIDHRFRDEPKGPEETAWFRALIRFAGEMAAHDGERSF